MWGSKTIDLVNSKHYEGRPIRWMGTMNDFLAKNMADILDFERFDDE